MKVRHEAVMRRTMERGQASRPKHNRWSWGGPLHPNSPVTPTGTLPGVTRSQIISAIRMLPHNVDFEVSSELGHFPALFLRSGCFSLNAQYPLCASISLPCLYLNLTFPLSFQSLSFCLSCSLQCIVLRSPGPGFVESARLYPLDLAGLEHVPSAFSVHRGHRMRSQCTYSSVTSASGRLHGL